MSYAQGRPDYKPSGGPVSPQRRPSRISPSTTPGPQTSNMEAMAEARRDLSEAQRSRGAIQARLDDVNGSLQKLMLSSAADRKRLDELTTEKATLNVRLRDQDEELKGKAKLLEAIHDETVSLTLQLNMAEEQAEKLKAENQTLVTRWMDRMGKEADAMNEASKFT
ncbi:MAG: hypothetical protein Q9174_000735 [Haloplaca sp. 1 TL-2023]